MDQKKNLETSLVMVTGLVIIYLIKDWMPLLVAATVIGLVGIFMKKPASWISWLWYKIAEMLGKVVPKLILSVVFFVVLFPLSVIFRLSGGDTFGLKDKDRRSMWIQRDHTFSKDDIGKPW